MSSFAVIADPHVSIPNPDTGWTMPPIATEPTMYDRSVELLEAAIAEINALPEIDFVVVAGDLTKDSERYNHDRARELFTRFRKPVYCVPGNHDQPRPPRLRPPELLDPDAELVVAEEIPRLYGDFGFDDPGRAAYSCDPAPDIHLVGLCSQKPHDDRGWVAPEVLDWLERDLARQRDPRRHTVVVLHHSIVEHVPGEATDPRFSWFHVENAAALKAILRRHRVQLTFAGHLHIQDVQQEEGVYNVVTSSLASYPHAYRIVSIRDGVAEIRSRRLQGIPSLPHLQQYSRSFTERVFVSVLAKALMGRPFHYPAERAWATAEKLRDWWPSIADGDAYFAYDGAELGEEALAAYVNSFSDRPPADNDLAIDLAAD